MGKVMTKTECEDRELICADCGLEFLFTAGEQRFYRSKGLAEPKRCKACRMLRRRNLVTTIQEEHNERNRNNKSIYH